MEKKGSDIMDARENALQMLAKINSDTEKDDLYDFETAHVDADEVLATLLIELGYEDVVEEYRKVPKQYA